MANDKRVISIALKGLNEAVKDGAVALKGDGKDILTITVNGQPAEARLQEYFQEYTELSGHSIETADAKEVKNFLSWMKHDPNKRFNAVEAGRIVDIPLRGLETAVKEGNISLKGDGKDVLKVHVVNQPAQDRLEEYFEEFKECYGHPIEKADAKEVQNLLTWMKYDPEKRFKKVTEGRVVSIALKALNKPVKDGAISLKGDGKDVLNITVEGQPAEARLQEYFADFKECYGHPIEKADAKEVQNLLTWMKFDQNKRFGNVVATDKVALIMANKEAHKSAAVKAEPRVALISKARNMGR